MFFYQNKAENGTIHITPENVHQSNPYLCSLRHLYFSQRGSTALNPAPLRDCNFLSHTVVRYTATQLRRSQQVH